MAACAGETAGVVVVGAVVAGADVEVATVDVLVVDVVESVAPEDEHPARMPDAATRAIAGPKTPIRLREWSWRGIPPA